MKKTQIGYHFSQENGKSLNGKELPFEIGEYRHLDGELELCSYGYHGCKVPSDALIGNYIYGPVVELCEFDLPIIEDEHKFVSSGKRVLKSVDISGSLRLFAADCAERVLPIFEERYPYDNRFGLVIQAVRDFVAGKISREELDIAADAADAARAAYYAADAAYYAAASAYYAAYYADDAAVSANAASAYCAAYYAADAAVSANAASAYCAARAADAERKWQVKKFNAMVKKALK